MPLISVDIANLHKILKNGDFGKAYIANLLIKKYIANLY